MPQSTFAFTLDASSIDARYVIEAGAYRFAGDMHLPADLIQSITDFYQSQPPRFEPHRPRRCCGGGRGGLATAAVGC